MERVVRTFLKNNKGKYLLVKHCEEGFWTLPGGHIEEGENIYKALKREIKEELNLDIKILGNRLGLQIENIKEKPLPICIYRLTEPIKKKKKKLEYIFSSEIKAGEMKVQEDEIYDCKFFTKDEILAEDEVYPQIKEIIKTFRFEQKKI